MTRWRNRQSSTKAGDAHAQAKKTSLLTRKESLVPSTLESMPDVLPRRPVVAILVANGVKEQAPQVEVFPGPRLWEGLCRLWSNEHTELKVSLGVLLHPEHRFEVEACRVGRICRVIDLGWSNWSRLIGTGPRESFLKSESNISVRSIAAGIPPTASHRKLNWDL